MNSPLHLFALCVLVLFIKMLGISCYQGFFRLRHRAFTKPEDAGFFQRPANAQELKVTRTSSRIETFVTANEPSDGVLKPTGSGLELVPVTNPTELRAGEKATWRFLLDGKPAANLPFSLIPGGVRYRGTLNEVRFSTDAKGEITFTIPAAGMYVATASWPAQQAQGGQQGQQQPPARRVTYSATVEVLPE